MPGFRDPEIYRTILESLKTGLCVVDRQKKIVFWNQGAEAITGYLRHEVVGHACNDNILQHCNDTSCELCGERCALTAVLHDARAVEATGYLHHKVGHRLFVHLWVLPLRDEHGSVIGTVQCFDARVPNPDRRTSVVTAGFLDPVTGVSNHAMMQSRLREALATFTEVNISFGVLCIHLHRLDHFRSSYGPEAEHSILRVAAQTIVNSLRPSDYVGRWAEDKFLAVLTGCRQTALDAIGNRIARIVASGGIEWWGEELHLPATVSKTVPQAKETLESLLRRIEQPLQENASGQQAVAATAGDPSGLPVS
jgi:PAS domain S-box-containing protein/diguanylate cyclase (GGDEF)-like protein